MARPLRLQIEGGVYHVVSRGNARQKVFLDSADRRRFLAHLATSLERHNALCHAYCLMGNHYHLLVETPDANLSRAVHQINGTYAQSFNRRYDRVGHVFQGRFGSKLVEKETYLLSVARYIVLNPVRAGLVETPALWIWSSYRAQVGLCPAPAFLTTDWLWSRFGTDRRHARHLFHRFVAEADDDAPLDRSTPVLGSEAFVARYAEAATGEMPLAEIPRARRLARRPTLQRLLSGARNRSERDLRVRRAYLQHGYTMRQIADHLGLHVMTVSRAVRSVVDRATTGSEESEC